MFFKRKEKKYKFSVVMPVYNTEKYLDDAIGSVIGQSIGFEKNIQLIIVNDGSTDNSHQICMKYKDRFPENIIYIDQPNQGAAAARNNGLQYAKGSYINFFDSDDIWNIDAFQLAWDFFQNNDDIDVIGCIQSLFEAQTGYHNLSNKFREGDRIIDIWETPHFIQLSVSASFIRTTAAKRYRFDTELRIGEDAKYITEIILEKEKYGALQSAVYNVRKREDHTSLTQNPDKSKFTSTINRYYKYLPELSIKKYGTVIPYIQHVVINGLKYRILNNNPLPLNNEEKEQYYRDIIALIKKTDDEVLLKTNMLLMPAKTYMLRLKYGHLPETDFNLRGNILYFKKIYLGDLSRNKLTELNIKKTEGSYIIKGKLNIPFEGDFRVLASDENNTYTARIIEDSSLNRISFNGDIITPGKSFAITLPDTIKISDYKFEISYNGHLVTQNIRAFRQQ